MAKKKIASDGIYFLGESSNDVTGSQYLVKFGNTSCLLECGLYQSSSNSYLKSYKVNSAKFKFNPSEVDFLFVNHAHIDHCGLIPRLVKEGFRGHIITTRHTAEVMKPLLLNSCYIVNEEARILSKKYGRSYSPLYGEQDVEKALSLINVYDNFEGKNILNDNLSFRWFKNSHCIGAAQLQLILSDGDKKKKILYTSDMGALNSQNHYVNQTEIPTDFSDVVIMESTYGKKERMSKRTRKFDLDYLESAIYTTVSHCGSVVMPCFSFSRTQEILTNLYLIYGKDPKFETEIVVDSKLSCELCDLYSAVLDGDDKVLWDSVRDWKNVRFIVEKQESKESVSDKTPKIIISSSGFCTNGRIVNYLREYLADRNSAVIFSGYSGNNSSYLSYRIKNYDEYKKLKINNHIVSNNANCISLSTFSSHANRDDLIKYGSSLNTNKLILVHGSALGKEELSIDLAKAISKNDKTYRVKPASKDMVVRL